MKKQTSILLGLAFFVLPVALYAQPTLHLLGTDGSTRLHIEDTGMAGTVQLLRLESDAQPRLTFVNNAAFTTWHQQVGTATGAFSWVPAGFFPAMDLDTSGNLTISGSLTTAGGVVPDYVFEPSYELMPLEEVEAFVKTEKHLPNIPNAEEIAANGLNVSEMQMRLLEKVEELTLYTIELQKRLEKQEEQLAELKAQR